MSKVNKTIQEKTEELNAILAWFDGEDFAVEQAIDKFKLAEEIAESIKNDLMTMKNEVNVLKQKFSE